MAVTKSALSLALLIALASTSPVLPSLRSEDALLSDAYTLPGQSSNPTLRAAGIKIKQETYLYGPGIGGGPYSPTGPLGAKYVAAASAIVDSELAEQQVLTTNDSTIAMVDKSKYNGLKTVEDYVSLYSGEWTGTTAPTGVSPGLLTNYTSDLLFAMERLAFQPYAVYRLNPSSDSLPFQISDATVKSITGNTLEGLFQAGRLFFVDYTAQNKLPRNPDQHVGAPQAYFYISPTTSQFMPLAIRTGVGKNLTYTPEDTANDWLLAKMLFNANDAFYGLFYHLPATHYPAEIGYDAAVRTLSQDHPIMAMLDRLLSGELGIRLLATLTLSNPNGTLNRYFGFTGAAAQEYANDLYASGFAGNFQSNYFLTNLEKRGLINSAFGPALKNFPFYEDALALHQIINQFMTSFVNSYYSSNEAVTQDTELQAWLVEANGPAKVLDFPTKSEMTTKTQLINLLTHFGHIASTAHHTLNLNEQICSAGVLPFHPFALYKPIPTAKGVTDVASFLPPVSQAIGSIEASAEFSRPLMAGGPRRMTNMFNDATMLSRMNAQTRAANTKFMAAMKARSAVVSARTFDAQGLSQGMPFVWKALDPEVIPFTLTI